VCHSQLKTVWSSADDHEGQKAALFGFVVALLGSFKRNKDAAPHRRVASSMLFRGHRGAFIVPISSPARPARGGGIGGGQVLRGQSGI
jgi:hypothetical protein